MVAGISEVTAPPPSIATVTSDHWPRVRPKIDTRRPSGYHAASTELDQFPEMNGAIAAVHTSRGTPPAGSTTNSLRAPVRLDAFVKRIRSPAGDHIGRSPKSEILRRPPP